MVIQLIRLRRKPNTLAFIITLPSKSLKIKRGTYVYQWRILGVHSVRLHPGGLRGAPKRRGEKERSKERERKKRKEKGRQRRREGKGKKICKRKGKERRNQKKIGYKKKNTRVATR